MTSFSSLATVRKPKSAVFSCSLAILSAYYFSQISGLPIYGESVPDPYKNPTALISHSLVPSPRNPYLFISVILQAACALASLTHLSHLLE
ncbi:hypothetical protein EH204_20720 [Pectobacterium carotovorum subsp. carotovorum]|nr:hypothetical protein EH204_20720 [Pectobacterium carotovorum subsp. carotovorum]